MKHFIKFCKVVVVIVFITTVSSCHKEGGGGKSTVNGYVTHHGKVIPHAIVYIKYGATEFPGADVSSYDASLTTDVYSHYEFDDLRMGNYYLYGLGYDNDIMQTVAGGVGVKLKYDKTTHIDVPVTEQ